LSWQSRYNKWLISGRGAEAATLTETTGSVCPCMTSWDANNPSYSEQWHRDNPAASDCDGTGIIHATETDTAIYGVFSPPGLFGESIPKGKEDLFPIGEVQKDDLILWGVCNASKESLDLTYKSEYVTKITKGGVDYTIKDMSYITTEIGQVALLRRR
jgi:hypothetical protein